MNGIQLFGLNHVEVVSILKDLPQHVRLVCCRRRPTLLLDPNDYLYAPVRDQFFQIPSPPPSDPAVSLGLGEFPVFGDRLVKAKSEQALPVAEALPEDLVAFSRLKSRSLELLTGLAMWGNDVVELELEKGDRGLGFSILDYQVSDWLARYVQIRCALKCRVIVMLLLLSLLLWLLLVLLLLLLLLLL